jgi:hypothetical protein
MANTNPKTEHLTPFRPGTSGNPAGRPAGIADRRLVAKVLAMEVDLSGVESFDQLREMIPELPAKGSAELFMIAAQVHRAIHDGDTKAFSALMDRAYGRPATSIEVDARLDQTIRQKGSPLMERPIILSYTPLRHRDEEE